MAAGAAGVTPAVIVLGGLAVNYVLQQRVTSQYDYRCERCGETFSLSAAAATFAPHRIGGRKWTRCPSCGRFSWATPVPKG